MKIVIKRRTSTIKRSSLHLIWIYYRWRGSTCVSRVATMTIFRKVFSTQHIVWQSFPNQRRWRNSFIILKILVCKRNANNVVTFFVCLIQFHPNDWFPYTVREREKTRRKFILDIPYCCSTSIKVVHAAHPLTKATTMIFKIIIKLKWDRHKGVGSGTKTIIWWWWRKKRHEQRTKNNKLFFLLLLTSVHKLQPPHSTGSDIQHTKHSTTTKSQ